MRREGGQFERTSSATPPRGVSTLVVVVVAAFSAGALRAQAPTPKPAPDTSAPDTSAPDTSAPDAPAEGEGDADRPEGIEFVDEGPSPFDEGTEPMDLPAQEAADTTPPSIDDFAVAAGSREAAVRVTAVVTDDASGIEAVELFYRVGDEREFAKVALEGQTGGLFMGILPDGPQRTGFAYYAEAKDAAGNVARLGDSQKPFKVPPAGKSGMQTLEESRFEPVDEPLVAPVWIALALGAGVIGAAGGALFLVDFARLYFFELPTEPTTTARYALIQQLAIGDLAIGGILAVIGTACLITGTGLLVVAAFDE